MNALAVQQRFPEFTAPEHAPDATIAERFVAFHEANPWVADRLEELALADLELGLGRVGVKYFFELLRRDYRVTTRSADWKLNNDFSSRYARLLIERRPELAEVIETRELRS